MAKFIDNQCNVEFPSDADYLLHKKANHSKETLKGNRLETSIPSGVPPEALPSPEFIATINRLESQKQEEEPSSRPSQHPTELPAAAPIKLTYVWTGECSEHRRPVSSLELDVAEKHFSIAFCPAGNHQIEAKEVAQL